MNPPPPERLKVVFDCNVFLQALGNPFGPAGQCLQAAFDRNVQLFIDRKLLEELVEVARRPTVVRALKLLPRRVDALMLALAVVATLIENVRIHSLTREILTTRIMSILRSLQTRF
jgi:predicted nucleic acid-binding protein